jgi:hypothetical protein
LGYKDVFFPTRLITILTMAEAYASHLSHEDQVELQRCFPRMSWWLRMAHSRPDLPNAQTSQPASPFQGQNAAHPINQTQVA